MFKKKKKSPIDPAMLDEIIKNLQGDDSLYSFNSKFKSEEYRFSVYFPDTPTVKEFENGRGAFYTCTTPDSIVYSVMVLLLDPSVDRDAVVNDYMDGITDTPNWHELYERIDVNINGGHPALSQTFISDTNTVLNSVSLAKGDYLYSIQVQNVYLEHMLKKLSAFTETFTLY